MDEALIAKRLYDDDRTNKLLSSIYNLEDGDEGLINKDKIMNIEFTPYDTYRLMGVFAGQYCHDELLEEMNTPTMQRMNMVSKLVLASIPDSKMFMVDKKLKFLIGLTKPASIKAAELKLPFNELYFDIDFKIDEHTRVIGMMVSHLGVDKEDFLKSINETSEKLNLQHIGKALTDAFSKNLIMIKYMCAVNYDVYEQEHMDHAMILFDGFYYDLDTMKFANPVGMRQGMTAKEKRKSKLVKKIISGYVSNLLLFLNEPRIKVSSKPDLDNQKRIKRGKIPLPSLLITRIDTSLKEYMEKIYYTGESHSKLDYSFWVRGHWMMFKSNRYINMKGQKIWVAPYIKGEGLMPPQVFLMS